MAASAAAATSFFNNEDDWLAMIDQDSRSAVGRFDGTVSQGICQFGATQ